MTIWVCYHFGAYRNFKEYYLNCVKGVMHQAGTLWEPIWSRYPTRSWAQG